MPSPSERAVQPAAIVSPPFPGCQSDCSRGSVAAHVAGSDRCAGVVGAEPCLRIVGNVPPVRALGATPDGRDCPRGAHGRRRSHGCLCPVGEALVASIGADVVAPQHQGQHCVRCRRDCRSCAVAGAKLANGGAGSPLADRSRPLCRADPVVSQPDAVSRSRSLAAGARPGARSVGRSAGAPGAARGAGARCSRRVAPALTCSRSPVPGGCGGRGGCSRRARRRRRLA